MIEYKYNEFTAIVPSYNEAKRFEKVVDSLLKIKQLKELIFVDDGSTDDTTKKIKKFKSDKRFIYIKHPKNKGKGAALKTGVKRAKFEVILFLDADLGNINPDKIKKIIQPVLTGKVDVSRGAFRRARGRVTEYAVKPMMNVLFPDIYFKQPISGQVCAKKSFLKTIDFESNYGVDIGILFDAIQAGQRIVEVDIGFLEHKANDDVGIAKMAEQVLETMIKKAGLIQHKYKLIVFTLDKTLVKNGEIDKLFKKLGIQDEIEKTHLLFEKGRIDYREYLVKSAQAFKGVSVDQIEETVQSMKFEQYVLEVIRAITKRKYQVAILSSLFSPIVNSLAKRLGINNFDCIDLIVENGILTGKINFVSAKHWLNDDAGQVFIDSFQKIKNRAKARTCETIMVANSNKAIPLLEKVGLGIAYKPKDPELKAVAEKTIHILPELLAIIE